MAIARTRIEFPPAELTVRRAFHVHIACVVVPRVMEDLAVRPDGEAPDVGYSHYR